MLVGFIAVLHEGESGLSVTRCVAVLLAGLAAVQPSTYLVVNALRACLQDASVFWRCARMAQKPSP